MVEVHESIICDGCEACPIFGERYKSLELENYDLCGVCFASEERSAEMWVRVAAAVYHHPAPAEPEQQHLPTPPEPHSDPAASAAEVLEVCEEVHMRIICDGCEAGPIIGKRYKSLEKADYDLCETCYGSAERNPALWCRMTPKGQPHSLADPVLGVVDRAAHGDRRCPSEGEEVHMHIICDGCEAGPIIGKRYKSLEKADYDLCETCYGSAERNPALWCRMTPKGQPQSLADPVLAVVDRATYGDRHCPGEGEDVTPIVNALIAVNGLRNATGKCELNEVFGDPAIGTEKCLFVVKGPSSLELLERHCGGPEDCVYDLSPLFQNLEVELAIYASIENPDKQKDVTETLNELITRNSLQDITAQWDLNDVFGDPAVGEVKKVTIFRRGVSVELLESTAGGPADKVYDISALFGMRPADSAPLESPAAPAADVDVAPNHAVDSAAYVSVAEPSCGQDVTERVNELLRKNGAKDLTAGADLNEVLGDPAFGHEKRLVVTKGARTVQMLEQGKGHPCGEAYSVAGLFQDDGASSEPAEALDDAAVARLMREARAKPDVLRAAFASLLRHADGRTRGAAVAALWTASAQATAAAAAQPPAAWWIAAGPPPRRGPPKISRRRELAACFRAPSEGPEGFAPPKRSLHEELLARFRPEEEPEAEAEAPAAQPAEQAQPEEASAADEAATEEAPKGSDPGDVEPGELRRRMCEVHAELLNLKCREPAEKEQEAPPSGFTDLDAEVSILKREIMKLEQIMVDLAAHTKAPSEPDTDFELEGAEVHIESQDSDPVTSVDAEWNLI